MRTTESIIVGTNRNNQRIYIKRPCKEFDGITAYRDAFANEAQNGMQCNHPHLLRYMGMEEDEQGPFIALEYIPSMPLNRAVVEDSLNIRTEQEAKSIMMQLIDAVEYLHNKGIHHLNIRPENILITKRAHDVKLINPSSTYLHCQPSFFLLKEKYTAPELFADSEDINYQVCDVYSIGKVMEYLYSFCNLSTGTSRIIRKATHPNPAKRYGHVGLMKKELEQARYIDWSIQVLKLTAAAIFFGGIYYGFKDDEASEENIQFAQDHILYNRQHQQC